MKRVLAPAPAARARFPRLPAAWRILAGAAPLALAGAALADATVPPPPGHETEKKTVTPCPLRGGQAGSSEQYPMPGGVIAAPQPPVPPLPKADPKKDKAKAKAKPAKEAAKPSEWRLEGFEWHVDAQPLILHPHGPDEPCRKTRRT
jgi:hypothetical protein